MSRLVKNNSLDDLCITPEEAIEYILSSGVIEKLCAEVRKKVIESPVKERLERKATRIIHEESLLERSQTSYHTAILPSARLNQIAQRLKKSSELTHLLTTAIEDIVLGPPHSSNSGMKGDIYNSLCDTLHQLLKEKKAEEEDLLSLEKQKEEEESKKRDSSSAEDNANVNTAPFSLNIMKSKASLESSHKPLDLNKKGNKDIVIVEHTKIVETTKNEIEQDMDKQPSTLSPELGDNKLNDSPTKDLMEDVSTESSKEDDETTKIQTDTNKIDEVNSEEILEDTNEKSNDIDEDTAKLQLLYQEFEESDENSTDNSESSDFSDSEEDTLLFQPELLNQSILGKRNLPAKRGRKSKRAKIK